MKNKPFNETIADIYAGERHILRVPVRMRMHRKRGYVLQDESRKINGLDAVLCSRSTKFGNPFRVIDGKLHIQDKGKYKSEWKLYNALAETDAVWMFKYFLINLDPVALSSKNQKQFSVIRENLHTLRGKNLACFCKEGQACHADVLLKLANL